ncbi:MAG: sensory rhodopsin transducer [Eubacteriales bacterium]
MEAIGRTTWVIPDMFWPKSSAPGVYVSHEEICVLNASENDCDLDIELFFEEHEPIILSAECAARRTKHIRMDNVLDDTGSHIPRGVAYSAVVTCSVPCVVQYTRLDASQSANGIMTTMGFGVY